MARMRFSDEDIPKVLRRIEIDLASGNDIKTASHSAGIRDAHTRIAASAMAGWAAFSSPR